MRARSIAIIMDGLFLLPFIFAASSWRQITSRDLIFAAILAFLSIAFRWYKHLGFEDRFLLAIQGLIFTVAINLFLPFSLSIEGFAESVSLPVELIYVILFYLILIIIGVYTTFWTRMGFVGVPGDPQVVRKDSLILLACVIAVALGIIFLPDFLVGWLIITGILWRSTVYFEMRAYQPQRTNKIE